MSFFLAVVGNNVENLAIDDVLQLRSVYLCQPYVLEAVERLLGVERDVFILSSKDDDTCQAIIESTQNEIFNGYSLLETDLAKLLLNFGFRGCTLCLWYATDNYDEFNHLVYFSGFDDFMNKFGSWIYGESNFSTLIGDL